MRSIHAAVLELRAQGEEIAIHWTRAAAAPENYLLRQGTAWSPLQILEHLTITQNRYTEILRSPPDLAVPRSPSDPRGTILGRVMRWTMDSSLPLRLPAPAAFLPPAEVDHISGGERFTGDREWLVEFVARKQLAELASVRLSSPADARLRLNGIDAIDVLLAHERRHLRQLRQRLAAAG